MFKNIITDGNSIPSTYFLLFRQAGIIDTFPTYKPRRTSTFLSYDNTQTSFFSGMHFFYFAKRHRGWVITTGTTLAVLVALHLWVPRPLFDRPTATVVTDRQGILIGARIASDEQWRFPESDSISDKFARCIVACEDRRYYYHLGIDPIAIGRALYKNITQGHVTEGGSTLTMQLARMARGNQERTLWQKIIEAIWAIDIELTYSKRDILRLYASHAPFGGNTVGLDAAAWRYFGRQADHLTWAENATLAVLPNSPALIHLNRNRQQLQTKRDALLLQLHEQGILSEQEYLLALDEPLPQAPHPIPNQAPHLLSQVARHHAGQNVRSTIDLPLQNQVQQIADRYSYRYKENYINDIAILVADVETGEVLAYVGNSLQETTTSQVDNVISERSTGSLLKPILYAAMLSSADATPRMIFADTPLNINGFCPNNYNKTFSGIVHADDAVTRSLNVPLVRMLSDYGTERFLSVLRWLGMTTLHYPAGHYGASLILGGAEGSLWDMTGMYASLSRRLLHYCDVGAPYDDADIHPLRLSALAGSKSHPNSISRLSAASIWYAYQAMSALSRPEEESDWQNFSSMKRVAWKTGTSWGARDGWAIGTTTRYVVGVWVGNATGEGRAGLTGVGFAAPPMFDVFTLLEGSEWFTEPRSDMQATNICKHSGYIASSICGDTEIQWIPKTCIGSVTCPYCRYVHLSADGAWQVNSQGESVSNIHTESRFVLPPVQEYYYANHSTTYQPLPPMRPDCIAATRDMFSIIYPEHRASVVLPRSFGGAEQRMVCQAACRDPEATLFWHIDDCYVGQTHGKHDLAIAPSIGTHTLTLVDQLGNKKTILFEVK